MLLTLCGVWFAVFYILVRQTIFYISFYALTFQIASMVLLSISAGRLVVEKKLLDNMNEKKREEFKVSKRIFGEQDKIQNLAEDEQSEMWRPGMILYAVALPLVWMSMFLFYTTNMSTDIHCTLSMLGNSGSTNSTVFDPDNATTKTTQYFQSMCLNEFGTTTDEK
jgi:hypothetical protein